MRIRSILTAAILVALTASYVAAQRPRDGGRENAPDANGLVTRLMAFDKDGDGKLARSEITDDRLTRLFDRADTNKDGIVTKDELTVLAAREDVGGGPGFGPPGFGPPPMGGGPGGPPGLVLPPPVQQRLGLTAEQKTQVEELQKEVDGKLDRILNAEQKAQLKRMRERGPGGFGPPGGGRPPRGGGPPPPGDGAR